MELKKLDNSLRMLSTCVEQLPSNGLTPVNSFVITKIGAISLLDNSVKLLRNLMELHSKETSILSNEERLTVVELKNNMLTTIEKISYSPSFFVVLGKSKRVTASNQCIDTYTLIDELDKVELTEAIREWLEKHNASVVDKNPKILTILDNFDKEVATYVEDMTSLLSKFKKPTKKGCFSKTYVFVSVPDAIAELEKTLSYAKAKLEKCKDSDKKEEYQEFVDTTSSDIAYLKNVDVKHCTIARISNSKRFGGKKYAQFVCNAGFPSYLAISDFLKMYYAKEENFSCFLDDAKDFIKNRLLDFLTAQLFKMHLNNEKMERVSVTYNGATLSYESNSLYFGDIDFLMREFGFETLPDLELGKVFLRDPLGIIRNDKTNPNDISVFDYAKILQQLAQGLGHNIVIKAEELK